MDQKSWLWKKRSTEKTLVADKSNNSLGKYEEVTEMQKLRNEKTELEREIRILDEKLTFALSECNAKDDIAKKQVKIAEEAIAGWEKAEIEAVSLKKELDKVLQQKAASEKRICHLDAALKECMQQLRFVQEEQEQRVQGAVLKTSEEFDKIRIALDEKLAEAGKRLAKLEAENTQLSKVLSGKDKVIKDSSKYRDQVEADFNALMSRVETTEKENASLKYEVRVLEKELDIRNEEREFNRRTTEVGQKQHQENVKKIGKLEMECQRLRLLVQKRLPGPVALAKMKSEVEMLGKAHIKTRRRKSNPSSTRSMEFCIGVAADSPSKRINTFTQQLHAMEEENKTLKDASNKNSGELQFCGSTYVHTDSSLLPVEGQVEESIQSQNIVESGKNLRFLQEHSLAASSDLGSDDKASCAESWASALISELEHFKNKRQLGTTSCRNTRASDMHLMDDFAEMEKLAVVSVDYPAGSSHHSSEEGNEIIGTSKRPSGGHSSSATCMELIPAYDCPSGPLISGHEIPSEYMAANRVPQWLSDILNMLLEHCRVSQRNPHEVLEDMKAALAHSIADTTVFCGSGETHHPDASYKGSGHVILTSPNISMDLDASEIINGNNISSTMEGGHNFNSNVSTSIHKILELLEGIVVRSQDNGAAESLSGKDDKLLWNRNSENATGYMVRVFQWKTTELSAILQQLVLTCNDLLNGRADLEQFALQVASNLEWVVNHCFSIQDVSSMKEEIRNHFDWDESISETEVHCGLANQSADQSRLHNQREDMPYLPTISPLSGCGSSHMEALSPPIREEGKTWNVEQANNGSSMVELEGRPQSEIVKGECFRIQLQESKNTIENLHSRMETTMQSTGKSGNQIERQKMIKEDLETQLMEINNEWREACQKISRLENELENKNNLCRRLEETCQDLKIQLESKDVPDNGKPWEKQLQNDWEISAASEKLAECQETILSLGKQLKALASTSDAALFDKVTSKPAESVASSMSTPQKSSGRRSSLLDKMQAEDNDQIGSSPRSKEDMQNANDNSAVSINSAMEPLGKLITPNGTNHEDKSNNALASTDIVPRKKNRARSFFRKLFWRQKKGKSEKTTS